MKLECIRIQNFRSCRNVTIHINSMHALVGANNAGKSTILRAMDFLFNPSTRQISEETFWNRDTALKIRVEGLFTEFQPHEKTAIASYLRPDGKFHVAREAIFMGKDAEPDEDDTKDKIKITPQYNKPLPKLQWLRDSEINKEAIEKWMREKETLVVNEQSFTEFLDTENPTIMLWQQKAAEFAANYLNPEDYEDSWVDNPKGYANVLKKNLPFFVLIPAVRDITDESKVSKTNPFGRLMYAVMNAVTQKKRDELRTVLKSVAQKLNREGGKERLAEVCDIETKLNTAIKEIFADCDVELEFQTPTFEVLMASPKIYVDDGFRGLVENKGHGLQRAAIFSILRSYADLVTSLKPEYVFSWTKIPGTDDNRLKEFLSKRYNIDWICNAGIVKSEDGKIINISKRRTTLSLTLTNEDSEVILKINNNRTDNFVVKKENSELNIYKTESKRSFILGIEEPELYMHPQAQRTVRRVFRKIAAAGDQVLFSTHSSHFVDVADFDEIIRVESELFDDGGKRAIATSTWHLPMFRMVEDEITRHPRLKDKVTADSMREYYSHAYNPHRNEGFFAKRILLVEGDTEEYALPIYAEALGISLDMLGVGVVQCGGKGPMDRLYRIFNELSIPCYMLFDYDKNSDKKEIVEKSKELLAMVGESTEPPSIPIIKDVIACFPENWEATINKEIPNYEAIQTDAHELLGPDAGKPLLARYTARALAAKETPFIPPTIEEVLRKAVAVTWKGSCLLHCED